MLSSVAGPANRKQSIACHFPISSIRGPSLSCPGHPPVCVSATLSQMPGSATIQISHLQSGADYVWLLPSNKPCQSSLVIYPACIISGRKRLCSWCGGVGKDMCWAVCTSCAEPAHAACLVWLLVARQYTAKLVVRSTNAQPPGPPQPIHKTTKAKSV